MAELRLAAARSVLRRQGAAIVRHDRVAFLATVDPSDPAFRRTELTMFDNLRAVQFASWTATISAGSQPLPAGRQRRYDAPVWAPSSADLHYRIRGFDSEPTDRAAYPTFVRRSGRWYLASLSDFAARGEVSATDLWDYAPVTVVRRPRVLVLGSAAESATMTAVADLLQAAIPRVDAVWGRHWARRVVALVPSTQPEMGAIADDPGDLDQIAAVTSAEVSTTPGRPAPVGDRVVVNPANWPRLGPVGAAVVLTHELTHVATRADTGAQTPKWLSEGFAEYVGFLTSGASVDLIARELQRSVQAGDAPRQFPADHAFRGGNPQLSQAYESAWLACRYLAVTFGQPDLVRFYREVGTSPLAPRVAVAGALHRSFGLTPARFTARWRGYVRAQLAA